MELPKRTGTRLEREKQKSWKDLFQIFTMIDLALLDLLKTTPTKPPTDQSTHDLPSSLGHDALSLDVGGEDQSEHDEDKAELYKNKT